MKCSGPISQTLALAVLCVRSAVRSRFVICLVLLLLLTIAGLPMTIEGDGTLAGRAQVLLSYTLRLAAAIIGAAMLWVACGSISQEIENRQIHLTAVKPVRRFQIWLGKWLGLLAVCAALLAISGAAVYSLLRWNIAVSDAGAEERTVLNREILTGRRRVRPRAEPIHDEVHALVDRLIAGGQVPENESPQVVFMNVREKLLAQKYSVVPGGSRTWAFDLPAELEASLRNNSEITARFRFRTTSLTRDKLHGRWIISRSDGTQLLDHAVENRIDGTYTFSVPASALPPGETVFITFRNAARDASNTVVFDSEAGIEFLVTEASFERNLVMALAVVFCHLALLAAIGLTVSSVFSFPVATFTAASLLLVFAATHYFATDPIAQGGCGHRHHGEPEDHGLIDAAGQRILLTLAVVVEPAMELDSLELLADGILVSGRFAGKAVLLLCIIYPALFGLVAGACLNRRELALPG